MVVLVVLRWWYWVSLNGDVDCLKIVMLVVLKWLCWMSLDGDIGCP